MLRFAQLISGWRPSTDFHVATLRCLSEVIVLRCGEMEGAVASERNLETQVQ